MDVGHLRHLAISDSGFVFDPITGFTFSLNPTGLFILRQLKDGCSVEQVVVLLQREFDSEADDLVRDVDDFVRRLRDQGLLR